MNADPGLVWKVVEGLGKCFAWVLNQVKDEPKVPPTERLNFVPQRHMWSEGTTYDKPGMQFMTDWWVSNGTEQNVIFLRAELTYRKWGLKKCYNQMQIMGGVKAKSNGEIRILFFVVPRTHKDYEDIVGRVTLIDNFNRRHELPKVTFKSPKTPKFPN